MSVPQSCLLVSLLELLDEVFASSCATPTGRPGRGRPRVYPDVLFTKALVIMVVKRLTSVSELWNVLHEPTSEMHNLREMLSLNGRFACRRTWERRLQGVPQTLPAQIHLLGQVLLERLKPFASSGRAVAIDSTLVSAYRGFQWHKKDKEQGVLPHPGIDVEATWSKSGHHGWVYGWKLHVVVTCGAVWIPLAARLTPAHIGDGAVAVELLPELCPDVRFVLGDAHYNTPEVKTECALRGQTLVASGHGRHPRKPTPTNSHLVRALFHKLRSCTIENFNQQYKALFDLHRPTPTRGHDRTQCWALGALLTYQLLLLYRFTHNQPLRRGLKYALHAA